MNTTPDFNTLPPFYKNYVMHVHTIDMLEALRSSGAAAVALMGAIPEEKGEFRYAPGKWSIKELICHIMDAERIFCYRALRFSRNDATPLSGFEENDFAPRANAHGRSIQQLVSEMKNLRASTIDLFASFTPEMLQRTGTANGSVISVVNLGYIVAGHETHHCTVLADRYLKK